MDTVDRFSFRRVVFVFVSSDQMGSPVSLCNGLYARLLLMGKSNGDLSVESRETTEEEEYGVFPVMERRRTRSGVVWRESFLFLLG
ncbi:hypothetical protein Bca4012_005954 [Brassica carinata]